MARNLKGLVYSTLTVGHPLNADGWEAHTNRKHCAMTTEVAASSHVTGDIQSRKGMNGDIIRGLRLWAEVGLSDFNDPF